MHKRNVLQDIIPEHVSRPDIETSKNFGQSSGKDFGRELKETANGKNNSKLRLTVLRDESFSRFAVQISCANRPQSVGQSAGPSDKAHPRLNAVATLDSWSCIARAHQ
jgi:hypothetical protein